MVFKHEVPIYLLEYKKNKLLVSGDKTYMYLVDHAQSFKINATDDNI